MTWSFQMGSLFGIPLRVHLTFLLLLFFVAITPPDSHGLGGLMGAAFVVALFTCVVIHELAHSLVARHYGVPVRHIILLPIGGISMMEKMPDEPRQEFNVAVVGPLTSLALAVVLGLIVYATGGTVTLFHPWTVWSVSGTNFLARLAWLNLILAGFNLIPAFPTDGGRVLRSLLALHMDYAQATHTAAVIGQGLAILLGFIGLFYNWWLILIAIFVYMGASAEDTQVRLRQALREVPAWRAMISDFRSLDRTTTLGEAFEYASHSYQHDFPVLDNGQLAGMVTRQALITGIQTGGAEQPVSEVMVSNPCRVSPIDSLADIYQELSTGACPIAAVTDQTRLVGLVTPESVSQYLLSSAYQRAPKA
ncbi:MAG: site-2 protease family protein [Armatimonadota bacterium]